MGSGGYAKVYEVFNPDKELYALKVINLHGLSPSSQRDQLKEVDFLSSFRDSPHVIRMIDHEHVENDEEHVLYILLERGEVDLAGILHKLDGESRLTPTKLRYFWEQMLEAVQTIHKMGIGTYLMFIK